MFRICFFFPRERFQKNYIYPFKWSRYHPMVQKFYCERYLSIQSMLGKKEKKYQHFNIFDYTYLPKTDICLSFFLFFSMNLSLWRVHCTAIYSSSNYTHLVPEGGSNDKKFSNGGKWLFWKVLMSTVIPQNFKSGPLGDFE